MDVCPNCHAGTLRRQLVAYAGWHALSGEGEAQFVVAPLPAWLCDVCGIKLFDEESLTWLTPLLGPAVDDAGSRPAAPRRASQATSIIGAPDRGRTS